MLRRELDLIFQLHFRIIIRIVFINFHRKWGYQSQNSCSQESDVPNTEWWKDAVFTYDNHPFCVAVTGPSNQKAIAHFLGNCSQNRCRRKTLAWDDLGLWCVPSWSWASQWVYSRVDIKILVQIKGFLNYIILVNRKPFALAILKLSFSPLVV